LIKSDETIAENKLNINIHEYLISVNRLSSNRMHAIK